jgi:hypothetical protein
MAAMSALGLRERRAVNGAHHGVAPNEWWDALMLSQARDEEIRVGLSIYAR